MPKLQLVCVRLARAMCALVAVVLGTPVPVNVEVQTEQVEGNGRCCGVAHLRFFIIGSSTF